MRRSSAAILCLTTALFTTAAFAQYGQPGGATITIIPPGTSNTTTKTTTPAATMAPTTPAIAAPTPPTPPKQPQPGGASMVGGAMMEHPDVLQPGTPQAAVPAAAAATAASTAPVAATTPLGGATPNNQRFDEMDTNHDGVITRQEILDSANHHFDMMDLNHDGSVTRAEFEGAVSGQGLPSPAAAQPPATTGMGINGSSAAPALPPTGMGINSGLPAQPATAPKLMPHY